ncbi:endothelin-converting enzyme 1 [Fusarium longipes]|uniref:Endothelin-converting enzyme 1 n=1 Tax=Fusarium longipes TaxID=694270 RepID=A0A395SMN3_9HYPO|nr:endothelin-converting enzyme 1 [Fusarium longipes]
MYAQTHLQIPLFNLGYPDCINYRGTDSIVGPEITHGSDYQEHMKLDSAKKFTDAGVILLEFADWEKQVHDGGKYY